MKTHKTKSGMKWCPSYHPYKNPRYKITISKWLFLMMTLMSLWPSPSTGRPLPEKLNNNASMVVRIVVSSSSSSTSDSDFAHLFPSPGNNQHGRKNWRHALANENGRSSISSKSLTLPNSSFSFNSQSNVTPPIFPIVTSSPASVSWRQVTNYETTTPMPTTYRPKLPVRLRASPLLFFLASTTTTSTTIKPLPFREDIFSVFYRAFSQQSHDSSSSSFLAFKSPIVRNSNPPEERHDRFQLFQNSPRKIPTIPNPFQVQPMSIQKGPPQVEHRQDKVVTSVVTRSSSVNVNYPRIRPSSFMMLSMANSQNDSNTKVLKMETPVSVNVSMTGGQRGQEEDAHEPLADWSSREFSIVKNKTTIFQTRQTTNSTQKNEPGQIKSDPFNFNQENNYPKAEALIQPKNQGNEEPSKLESRKHTLKSEVNKYWQPEQNWSEPAKVWGEPAKIWGQPEQTWGVQSQPEPVHSHSPTPIKNENTTDLWPKTHQSNQNDDVSQEEEGQGGTFYELDGGDDLPDTIPPELGQIPHGRNSNSNSNPNPTSWELPELTPQVGHSFVDSSSRSVEVAESIQVSLKREMDFRMRSSSSSSSQSSSNSNSKKNLGNGKGEDAKNPKSGTKFGYVLDGSDVRKYRVEERTPDGFIVGEYGVLNNDNGFLRGVRYTADGTINPRLIHEALLKFLSL